MYVPFNDDSFAATVYVAERIKKLQEFGGKETMKINEIVIFNDGDVNIEVRVSPEQETVWLTRNQIADLFDRDVKTIGKHINNALKEELNQSTVANFATVQKEGDREVNRNIEHYNFGMIISAGYRANF